MSEMDGEAKRIDPLPAEVVLALDVGTKTIGVAVAERGIVLPVCTIARVSVAKDCVRIGEICRLRKVVRVVVGLPYELDGSETRSARLARQVGVAVADAGWPVHYQDERFSTVEAIDRLGAAGVYGQRRKSAVDQVAAVVILEEWLRGRG